MADRNLTTALAFLAAAVGALLVVPTFLFPRATCLAEGPHHAPVTAGAQYAPCEVGRVPTLLVLVAAAVGLLLAVWRVDPE